VISMSCLKKTDKRPHRYRVAGRGDERQLRRKLLHKLAKRANINKQKT